jgi:FOG: HPt domain
MSAVIDWEQLDMIADGFTEEFVEIYREFLAEIPQLLAALQTHLEAADATQVARLAHQIKGSAANFGFIAVSGPMASLEHAAKGGSLAGGADLLATAQTGFASAVREVQERRGV